MQLTRQEFTATSVKKSKFPRAAIVFASSIIITLSAIFALAGWAEDTTLNHGVQHVMIFLGGGGAALSTLAMTKNRKDS